MSKIFTSAALAAAVLTLSSPGLARAEVGFGIGLSWVFGSEGSDGGLAAGAKVISDRKEGSINPAIGVDYLFNDQAIRPNIGAVYQDGGLYGDASFGYNTLSGGVDFSLGGGLSKSE